MPSAIPTPPPWILTLLVTRIESLGKILPRVGNLEPGVIHVSALPEAPDFTLATIKDRSKLPRVHHCFVPFLEVKVAQPVAQATLGYWKITKNPCFYGTREWRNW